MQEFTLTIEQRIYYYKKALTCFRSRFEGPFICNVLKWLIIEDNLIEDDLGSSPDTVKKHFPEFQEQLILTGNCRGITMWSENEIGNLQRELALRAAIAEAEMVLINSRSSTVDSTP